MRSVRLLATMAASVVVAFSAGHIIEHGDTTVARIGEGLSGQGIANASVNSGIPQFPRPPIETLQATPFPSTRSWAKSVKASFDLGTLDRSQFSHDNAMSCLNEVNAAPVGDGMIRVSVVAPCNVNEPVTIRHEGLAFTERTANNGRLTVDMPALTRNATVQAVFQDGFAVDVDLDVPDADNYRRVALTWRGDTGLHIHAQEFGADIGGPGHIWAGAPGRLGDQILSQGGYLNALGDASLLNANRAEVYTYPADVTANTGVVRLSVQAEVRNTNCGGIIAAHSLQPDGFGGVVGSDLTLRLPECHAVGEYIVLKNILRDLRIASN